MRCKEGEDLLRGLEGVQLSLEGTTHHGGELALREVRGRVWVGYLSQAHVEEEPGSGPALLHREASEDG